MKCPCGTSYPQREVTLFGKRIFMGIYCDACCDKREREAELEEEAQKQAAKDARWKEFCPVGYKDTDPTDKRLHSRSVQIANTWDFNSDRGFAFVGSSGFGKTRCMFLALHRAIMADVGCRWISHNKFSKLVIDAFSGDDSSRSHARGELGRLERCSVLLIDDLGKAPSTERADAELEELVESRTSAKKPILWTANAGGAWLAKRFGADRGEPIVRRLAEFCDVEVIR